MTPRMIVGFLYFYSSGDHLSNNKPLQTRLRDCLDLTQDLRDVIQPIEHNELLIKVSDHYYVDRLLKLILMNTWVALLIHLLQSTESGKSDENRERPS